MTATNGPADREYILLMRHAEQKGGVLTSNGRQGVEGVARGLAGWTDGLWRRSDRPHLFPLMTTRSPEVRSTADVLRKAFEKERRRLRAQHPDSCLPCVTISEPTRLPDCPGGASQGCTDPRVLGAYNPEESQVKCIVTKLTEASDAGRRHPLLVGNDPLVGWIAAELSRGHPVPIARGEMICLSRPARRNARLPARWRLEWNLAAEDQQQEQSIRDKIKSKMTTAAALGTVIVGLATFLLQNTLREPPTAWEWLALATLGASAALYFSALFLYDTLQMPTRFLGSRLPPKNSVVRRLRCGTPVIRRPPSSTARVLQASMVHIWTWIFTPATILVGAGVAFLALGASQGASACRPDWQLWQFAVALVAVAVLVFAWIVWHRPDLGASD